LLCAAPFVVRGGWFIVNGAAPPSCRRASIHMRVVPGVKGLEATSVEINHEG
jgi:hypothetical protein